MQIEITLTAFYAKGDEWRFFQGLSEITAIKDVRGVGQLHRACADATFEEKKRNKNSGIGHAGFYESLTTMPPRTRNKIRFDITWFP